jgi:hypothetical protein
MELHFIGLIIRISVTETNGIIPWNDSGGIPYWDFLINFRDNIKTLELQREIEVVTLFEEQN